MRKSLIAAGAAVLAIGGAGVAYAQAPYPAPAPTATASVSPSKAGTKKKPRSVKLKLAIKNNVESKTTATKITIKLPKNLKVSAKGLDRCTKSDEQIVAQTPSKACPKAIVGSGAAHTLLNPYADAPAPFNFKITALVGKGDLLFHLSQTNGGINTVLHGKLRGSTITISIPSVLYHPVGAYLALNDLSTTLSKHKGKHALISSVGCSGGADKIGVTIGYVNNGVAPAKPTASTTAVAHCKK